MHIGAQEDTITVREKRDKLRPTLQSLITRDRWALIRYAVKSKELCLEGKYRENGMD